MKIALTGASGFVGRNVLEKLLENNFRVVALVRNQNKLLSIVNNFKKRSILSNLTIVECDIQKPETYIKNLKDVDVMINLIGIIREKPSKGQTFEKLHFDYTKMLVDLSNQLGVKRFIQMSALGVKRHTNIKYFSTKYKAERYVIEFFENWTIVRPSIIIGKDGEFTKMIKNMLKIGIVPIIGDGSYKVQPVSINTVSNFFVYLLNSEYTIKKEYHLVGPKIYTYEEFIDTFAKTTGKRLYKKVHLPINFVKFMSIILGILSPITQEQVEMLLEGSTLDEEEAGKLPVKNIPIEEELRGIK